MDYPPRPPDTHPSLRGQQPQKPEKLHQEQAMPVYQTDTSSEYVQQQMDAPYAGGTGEIVSDQAALPKASRLPKLLLIGVVVIAIGLLLRFQVFAIRQVVVQGNRNIPLQTISKAAGLDRNIFYYAVNEAQIKAGINANRYLVFESLEKVFPSTLRLTIRERRPFAFFTHLGVGYVLSEDGIILEQTRELKIGNELMLVNGLGIWGQQAVGTRPGSTDPAQMDNLVELFGELALWGFTNQVKSLDIAQQLNITLLTTDGYTIKLGGQDHLHAKIGTTASVVNELRRRGMLGGIIEAARPGEATYREIR